MHFGLPFRATESLFSVMSWVKCNLTAWEHVIVSKWGSETLCLLMSLETKLCLSPPCQEATPWGNTGSSSRMEAVECTHVFMPPHFDLSIELLLGKKGHGVKPLAIKGFYSEFLWPCHTLICGDAQPVPPPPPLSVSINGQPGN